MPNIKTAQSFWMWFLCHQKVYLRLHEVSETEKEAWLDELLKQLHKYHKGLGYVLNLEHRIHAELIISAEGDFRLFEEVTFLISRAPVIDEWHFVDFIYPTEIKGLFTHDDMVFFPNDIYFTARKNNKRLGLLDLQLYMDATQANWQSAEFYNAVNLLLLNLLGEINLATTIGKFSVNDIQNVSGKKRLYALRELPEFVATRNVIRKLLPAMMSQGILF
ncbi:hypothetical protein L3C95_25385 [Chitinophaga filiformis]|uniref:hypothetical protein n=1 Tax=Chitinophaga filiformis TaxID=104663 RepID=UPI001F271A09|nr:hypothetical protein [Chitinophaga filiformis]MCF6406253.1 hypothetical protein [Chitinophaga filiformis]